MKRCFCLGISGMEHGQMYPYRQAWPPQSWLVPELDKPLQNGSQGRRRPSAPPSGNLLSYVFGPKLVRVDWHKWSDRFCLQLLSSNVVNDLMLLEPLLDNLTARLKDSSASVRRLVLRGLANMASGSPDKVGWPPSRPGDRTKYTGQRRESSLPQLRERGLSGGQVT